MGARFSAQAYYIMGTGSFSGVKRPGRGVDHPHPSSAEVEVRVELYLYSPSVFVACSRVNCTFTLLYRSMVQDDDKGR